VDAYLTSDDNEEYDAVEVEGSDLQVNVFSSLVPFSFTEDFEFWPLASSWKLESG
jgi:hypothetical protein